MCEYTCKNHYGEVLDIKLQFKLVSLILVEFFIPIKKYFIFLFQSTRSRVYLTNCQYVVMLRRVTICPPNPFPLRQKFFNFLGFLRNKSKIFRPEFFHTKNLRVNINSDIKV